MHVRVEHGFMLVRWIGYVETVVQSLDHVDSSLRTLEIERQSRRPRDREASVRACCSPARGETCAGDRRVETT